MNVVMMTDLEGVAGVVSFEDQAYASGTYYEAAKKLLTAEINAAVEGLLAAGVEDVLVIDGHGAGGVLFEELHPAANLLHGRPSAPADVRKEVIAGYDAAVIVGQHAMAGVADGNLAHTQSSRHIDYIKLNGTPIGETAQFALYCGGLGVPVIFLSGDHAACREVEALIPGITTAEVKQGLSRDSAISLSKEAARALIRERIQVAVEKQRSDPIAPLVWEPPYVLETRYFHTDTADAKGDQPGAERVDSQTVRFRSDDIVEIVYR
jgi:D-amino peptidase